MFADNTNHEEQIVTQQLLHAMQYYADTHPDPTDWLRVLSTTCADLVITAVRLGRLRLEQVEGLLEAVCNDIRTHTWKVLQRADSAEPEEDEQDT
jgi:hypothetical protein